MKVGFIGTGKLGGPVSEAMLNLAMKYLLMILLVEKIFLQRRIKKVDLESITKLSRLLFKSLL